MKISFARRKQTISSKKIKGSAHSNKVGLLSAKIASILLLSVASLSIQSYAENYAITGGKIHTMSSTGLVENGTVLIQNGLIKEVLSGVAVPAGYTEIDATGKIVTPGFIGALTNLGLVEVSMSAGVNDSRVKAHEISSVGAAYDVQYAINTDSTLFAITRMEGFTSAVTGLGSTGQLFDGQGAFISLSTGFNSVLKPQAFTHVDLGGGGADKIGESRAALWVALNQSLDEAKYVQSNPITPSWEWFGMISSADAAPLVKVVNGEMPLLVTANRANDILQVLALKERYPNIKLILVSASDGWRVAKQIAAAEVPVILSPEDNLPGQFDRLAATLQNAARLNSANVVLAIGIETHNARLAAQHAGNAVANGLDYNAALAALTINPAKMFGVGDVVGSLEAGKQADVVIWSGDPFEVTQAAEQVFIKGESMIMESRQTKLRDRYMHRDVTKPAAYSK